MAAPPPRVFSASLCQAQSSSCDRPVRPQTLPALFGLLPRMQKKCCQILNVWKVERGRSTLYFLSQGGGLSKTNPRAARGI